MTLAKQISAGVTLSIEGKDGDEIFYVKSAPVPVTVAKGNPLLKVTLINLKTNEEVEKKFKPDQTVQEVTQVERVLEYLYPEGNEYLFLDIWNLQKVPVPADVLIDAVHFLKEGIQITAKFYGHMIFSCDLPQFLELMVVKTEGGDQSNSASSTKIAHLETGAKIAVPLFIESGDMLKVECKAKEPYVQRI